MNGPSTCIVLAGGLGTRLRSVLQDVPKGLAPVRGRPFLAWQLASLAERGVERFVFALGHGSQQIEAALQTWPQAPDITCVVEPVALGTGGAIAHAMDEVGLNEALVANGDTFVGGTLAAMLAPLRLESGELLRIAAVDVPDRTRFGGLATDEQGRVTHFLEKGERGAGPINAGIYRLHRDALPAAGQPATYSLETDVMPGLVARGAISTAKLAGPFIDIGVPEDYRRFCEQHEQFC